MVHRLNPPYCEIFKIINTDLQFRNRLARKTRRIRRRTQAIAKSFAFDTNAKKALLVSVR